ncbi:MAG TPA: potassium-transporting ATPase subunit KdpC [Candidatus Wallbacteria bacterium]|nr:potassium-transporting ATPase subunit KdpC [Candidatus Wallbacteria bacterium]
MLKDIITAIRILIVLTIITGLMYPMFITVSAKALFREKAAGSLIFYNDKEALGSELIGQKFVSEKYFWPRPSAVDYNLPSGGSNLGPTSASLVKAFNERKVYFLKAHGYETGETSVEVPQELLFASASGIDPHISPNGAKFQIGRVANARKFDILKKKQLEKIVENLIEYPQFGFLGEPSVNVLRLNRALDKIK